MQISKMWSPPEAGNFEERAGTWRKIGRYIEKLCAIHLLEYSEKIPEIVMFFWRNEEWKTDFHHG